MNHPTKHNHSSPTGKFNYLHFDSVLQFNAFVDGECLNLSQVNENRWLTVHQNAEQRLKSSTYWYGIPQPKTIDTLHTHNAFLGMSLIKTLQPKIKDKLHLYLEHLQDAVLPKPKLAYNDRGLGVFSFERAAMAMYNSYPVNTSTPIDTTVSQMHIALDHTKVQTSVKHVYAYFKDKSLNYPSLRLYIMAGSNANIKGNELLYVGLTCAELVDFMEIRGISVEVNILIGTSFNEQTTMGIIRVKRFQDPLDKNQLLLMSSDPRYFRYRGFKALIALSNYFDLNIPSGLGRLTPKIGQHFVKAIAPNAFVFEQSYAMDSAVKEVTQIIETYKKRLTN